MKKTFNPKIGPELLIPISIIFGTVLFLIIRAETSWFGLAIILAVIFFVMHLFLTTAYTIEGENLTIKAGFLFRQTIDMKQIRKLTEITYWVSAPATFIDRIEISYNKFDSVMISAKDKKGFINAITSLHPRVEEKYKKINMVKFGYTILYVADPTKSITFYENAFPPVADVS